MKTLIIGFGSIGKRHARIMRGMGHDVAIVSGHKEGAYKSLEDAPLSEFDYFIIASETSKHLEQLKFLDRSVAGKKILCEKPLFRGYEEYAPENNSVFAGYVLRFHPVFMIAELLLKEEIIRSAEIYCGSYLPDWRQDKDYRTTYSAKKAEGGGVLLDLSHEIDYAVRLFGRLNAVSGSQKKVSDLEIDSDDTAEINGETDRETSVSIRLDYINPRHERYFKVVTGSGVMTADFSGNIITFDDGEVIQLGEQDRDRMYEDMHRDVLDGGGRACTYREALDVMKIIAVVQEQNR